ncbi:MAG: SH3 domain-containing protein [Chloroflexota bacterium]|nr:SH3 domain-containing protein [Chloroflexota bacterium]
MLRRHSALDRVPALASAGATPLRRLGLLAVALGLVLSVMLALPGPAGASCGACGIRTTAAVNLRSGPGVSYPVLLVVPAGAEVLPYGDQANGYVQVDYVGTVGWVADAYLGTPPANYPSDAPILIGTAVTTFDVNLRAGPSGDHEVLRVLPQGTAVQRTDFAVGPYRYVILGDVSGWVYDAYLTLT